MCGKRKFVITMLINGGELPSGVCYQNEQQRLNGYVQAITVTFPASASVFNYGSTTPTIDNSAFPWFKLNPDGSVPSPYWFVYFNGQWISPHSIPANYPISYLYKDSFSSLDTFDGGAAGTVTDTTGPMWQPDPDLYDRFAAGSGDPSGTPFFTPGETGGATEVVLAVSQVPVGNGSLVTTIIQNDFQIIPPFYAGIYIKRTARAYFVG